ncbi:baseplate J/gp47 family protein [Methanobrevibacter filiformis]|uniref:Baseplate J-like protein n=1 Tax=Methanobrevibacter filiformis TaxID=55758 RepID=A0A166FAU0_9EURY|nr:baseplate J/gp47 family protein [Methanobrevibacter filiformis]KZX17479.1 baseplate J-like protein [Methanobrevibacter filiformis]
MAEEDYDFDEETEDSLKMFTGSVIDIQYLVDNMFLDYKSKFENQESPISYLDEGGDARNLFETISLPLFEIFWLINESVLMKYIPYASGDFLDILGHNNPRNPGKNSTGQLQFSLPHDVLKDYDITIPAYSVYLTEDDLGLEYETIEEAILPAGENSILVPARSVFGGSEYNIDSNLVTIFEESIDDLLVTNPVPFIGGTDDEDDEYYRARLLYEQSEHDFGSVGWYKRIAVKIPGVHDVKVINCLKGDYTIGIIVNPPTAEIVQNVTNFFNTADTTPAGINAYIYGAETFPVDIIIQDLVFTNEVNPADVVEEIQNQINKYFNNLNISETIYRNSILSILSNINGLIDYTLISPSVNIDAEENQVLIQGETIIN